MSNVQVFDHHINMEGHRIGALGDPQSAQEAMTKGVHDADIAKLRAELAELRAKISPTAAKTTA